jgi:hypothetical protein
LCLVGCLTSVRSLRRRLDYAIQIVRQPKAQRELDIGNGHLAAKLREAYRHHGGSLLEKHKLGHGFDCNDRWVQRTALYGAVGSATGRAAAGPGGGGGMDAAGARVLDLEQVGRCIAIRRT